MGLFHKIFTSSVNGQSSNSRELHLTELYGTSEQAKQLMEHLEEDGHSIHDWWKEEVSEARRQQAQQDAQPWPIGKRHARRWGRA